jgi:hypothetical protein
MFTDIAAGHLIGDALVAERAQKPVKYLGRVALGNSFKDTGFLNISADIVQKRQGASEAANCPNQLRRTAILFGIKIKASTGIARLGCSIQPVSWG